MRHDIKFSNWIRAGGQSSFVLNLNSLHDLKTKFSVVPERLLDGIIDDALMIATQRLNTYLPKGVSVDIQSVDLSAIKDGLRSEIADRLSEIGVAVDQNDPKITAIIARYAEILNGYFQSEGLQLENYVWRSRDDARVRSAHAQNDDQVFFWSDLPEGGHPGQGWNCRCTAEPIIDQANIPAGAVCDILTDDRLAFVFPEGNTEKLAAIAREMDLRIVSGQLDSKERLIHFLAQIRQEAGDGARLVEGFNYNVRGLVNTYSYFRDNPKEAERFARTEDHAADPVSIANLALANRNGNGDAESGDGWTYRGRGLFQLTGRGNYRAFTEWHEEGFGEGIDFENAPDRAAEPIYAVRSAVYFWLNHDLPALADAGLTNEATDAITARINLLTATYEDRQGHMRRFRDGGEFDEICRFSVARPRFEDSE